MYETTGVTKEKRKLKRKDEVDEATPWREVIAMIDTADVLLWSEAGAASLKRGAEQCGRASSVGRGTRTRTLRGEAGSVFFDSVFVGGSTRTRMLKGQGWQCTRNDCCLSFPPKPSLLPPSPTHTQQVHALRAGDSSAQWGQLAGRLTIYPPPYVQQVHALRFGDSFAQWDPPEVGDSEVGDDELQQQGAGAGAGGGTGAQGAQASTDTILVVSGRYSWAADGSGSVVYHYMCNCAPFTDTHTHKVLTLRLFLLKISEVTDIAIRHLIGEGDDETNGADCIHKSF
ncbi:hypothetical protein T492DRAFT_838004 [Pavlovales sp. CCMP2436]|nr:hypothetical protein T492DRAFT_838004 [Pavlovales sp. CCMP2436]